MSAIDAQHLNTGDLAHLVARLNEVTDKVIALRCQPSEEGKAESFQEALWLLRQVRQTLECAVPDSPLFMGHHQKAANNTTPVEGGAS